MDPISAPLTRIGDINVVTEGLAGRDTTLSDTNGTIVPSCVIRKHAMVMERAGSVEGIGRMDDESVVHADGDWRRARDLHKNGEEGRGRGRPTAKSR